MGIQKRFGRRVRDLRAQRGWSVEALAEKCEAQPLWVSEVERGTQEVRILDLDRLARAFGISISDLFPEK